MKVHCLLDEDIGFFPDHVASEILCIPISRHGGDDFASWPFTRFGEYSVRSAYNMARSDKFLLSRCKHGYGQSLDRSDEEKFWKSIWKVKAPNKMKVTLWRFAQDRLPSRVQLARC